MTLARAAWPIAALLLILAFAGAWLLRDTGLLSRVPPATALVPEPAADVAADRTFGLYAAAFTAWAALLLLIPAYLTVWYADPTRAAIWRAFWSAAFVAYAVHLLTSMGLFFNWDFVWMTSTSRVSAFWPGMIVALWWPIDIALGARSAVWVRAQRAALHVVVLVLFVGGSAVMGELATVKILGVALFVAALVAFGGRLRGRRHA